MGHKKKTQAELEREELTKTQVLNLKELERVANYEKKVSKKPAAILASIGIFAIGLGICYPGMTHMLSTSVANTNKANDEVVRKQEERRVSTTANDLTCSLVQPNVAEGTVATTTFEFAFENDILKSYKKSIDIKVEGTVAATPASIVTLDTSLINLMQTPLPGYTLAKKPIASTTPNVVDRYQAELMVDFTIFQKSTLTVLHTNNYFATVEFEPTDTKEVAQQRAVLGGYTCK